MKWRIIKTLVAKDFTLFFRDKFFGIMTVFGIVIYIIFYFIMPRTVDETIEIGFYNPLPSKLFNMNIEEEGIIIRDMKTDESLRQAIIDGEYLIGISIPANLGRSLLSGEKPKIYVYYASDLPDEMKEMYSIFMNEMIYAWSGSRLGIDAVETVLGPDMGGRQIPLRNRMLPLFAFMLLVMETFGLANLISMELEHETVQALLTTPMGIVELFAGKGLTGVTIAFSQSVLFMIITGSLTQNILLIVLTLLLGAMMFTGLAFFIASGSKDMMSVVGWCTLSMLILIIPALSILFPGPVSGWMKVIPSYFLVDTFHRAVNFNMGWSSNANNILALMGFNILFIMLGIYTLKRKLI